MIFADNLKFWFWGSYKFYQAFRETASSSALVWHLLLWCLDSALEWLKQKKNHVKNKSTQWQSSKNNMHSSSHCISNPCIPADTTDTSREMYEETTRGRETKESKKLKRPLCAPMQIQQKASYSTSIQQVEVAVVHRVQHEMQRIITTVIVTQPNFTLLNKYTQKNLKQKEITIAVLLT